MNITDINRSAKPNKRRKRVGRGEASGWGKTSGRGHKGFGQKNDKSLMRTVGGQMPIIRTAPKRGFNNKVFRREYLPLNLEGLERAFASGDEVTPEALRAKGLARKHGAIKVLGRGELTKALTIRVHAVSAGAREKIEKAGGTVAILPYVARTPKDAKEETAGA